MSADAAGAPPDHVDIVRAGIRIHPDEPDDVMNVKTDAELIAYALRYLADDTEDHRPKTATRMRAIAAGIESGPVGMSDREKARDLGNQSAHLARGIADVLNDTLDALETLEKERDTINREWGVCASRMVAAEKERDEAQQEAADMTAGQRGALARAWAAEAKVKRLRKTLAFYAEPIHSIDDGKRARAALSGEQP